MTSCERCGVETAKPYEGLCAECIEYYEWFFEREEWIEKNSKDKSGS